MTGPAARVLFYVQHLLGIGHLRRAALLVRALSARGLETTLLSGGFPVSGLDIGGARLIQLEPVKAADSSFKMLVTTGGREIDERWREDRRRRVLDAFADIRPDAVILEMYPFGRRQMRFELDALIDAAKSAQPRPLLLSSVRDVLVAKEKPGRAEEIVGRIEQDFDGVLVHGDPRFIPFEASFPAAARLRDRLAYTGYVAPSSQPADVRSGGVEAGGVGVGGEVVVSAGGGAVGTKLIEAALAARSRTSLVDRTWRVITGENLAAEIFASLRARAPAGVVVERWRDDLPELFRRAALTISQAGYNTVMELVAAGTPAVVVPFADAGETEQSLRARFFEERNLLTVVPEGALDAASLAQGVAAALARPRPGVRPDMNGAEASARLVEDRLAQRGKRVACHGD